MVKWNNRMTDRQIDVTMDGWMELHNAGWMDGWMNGMTEQLMDMWNYITIDTTIEL